MCYQSTFWPIPSSFLTGSAAAGGLAMIVSIGNLGGFVGPYLIGVIQAVDGQFRLGADLGRRIPDPGAPS